LPVLAPPTEHIVALEGCVVIPAPGFTVTLNVVAAPTHPAVVVVGVTIYGTTPALAPVSVSI
jgi:hypothetical protein